MWLIAALVLQFIIRLRFPAQKSIARVIADRYGSPTVSLLRKFESIDYKERKCELDINFISNCIDHDLVPKFVQFKVANRGLPSSKVYKRCQQELLKEELSQSTLWARINRAPRLFFSGFFQSKWCEKFMQKKQFKKKLVSSLTFKRHGQHH